MGMILQQINSIYNYTYISFNSKPRFLDSYVTKIIQGWDDTKDKATARLTLLNNTKAAWEGYASGLDNIAVEFDKAEEEIKKVKKRFNLQAAVEDLEKRQKIFTDTKNVIDGMYAGIQHDYDVMTMTLPEEKKDFVKKEVKAVSEKLEVVGRFKELFKCVGLKPSKYHILTINIHSEIISALH